MIYKLTDSLILIKESFAFLKHNFGYKIIEDDTNNAGVFLVYQNEFRKVGISYDFRESIFNVDIIQETETPDAARIPLSCYRTDPFVWYV